jgi:hypothetical protein
MHSSALSGSLTSEFTVKVPDKDLTSGGETRLLIDWKFSATRRPVNTIDPRITKKPRVGLSFLFGFMVDLESLTPDSEFPQEPQKLDSRFNFSPQPLQNICHPPLFFLLLIHFISTVVDKLLA